MAEPVSFAAEQVWNGTRNWLAETEGERLPVTEESLAQFGLLEPATVRGRAIRYLPSEGLVGLVAVFGAPVVTQGILGIDPHRNPGGFHIANLGALHMLKAVAGATADVIFQIRNGTSAVQIGSEIFTSPSLGRTYIRAFGGRLIQVGGLAEGLVWAYPGYVAGSEITGLVTDNPTAQAVGGGAGAIGVPLGLRVWLGRAGMQKLAESTVGRLVGPVGVVTLVGNTIVDLDETLTRRTMTDEEITKREKAIDKMPWYERWIFPVMTLMAAGSYNPDQGLVDLMTGQQTQLTPVDVLEMRDRRIREYER